MENIKNKDRIIQKQEQYISSQNELIKHMKIIISTQEEKLELLEELKFQLEEENNLLKKHNKEILDLFQRTLTELCESSHNSVSDWRECIKESKNKSW